VDNDPEKAISFFKDLVFRHYKSIQKSENLQFSTPEELILASFSQLKVFDEFVRASEGIPRDGINILAQCAQKALEKKISVKDLRLASRTWYQRDKETAVKSSPL